MGAGNAKDPPAVPAGSKGVLADLHREFPDLDLAPRPGWNLIREWVERNRFLYRYEDYPFEAYNLIFLQRILSLRDWSEAAQAAFHRVTIATFRKFDHRQPGFSVSFFLRVENNMRELLREILQGMPGIDQDAAWRVVYRQSIDYQETVNGYFECLLQEAYEESERLLLNILPRPISVELKRTGHVRSVLVPDATVLFADFQGFTAIAERMAPERLVAELDACFTLFDDICDDHGLEKIKTIGDAYMGAAGLLQPTATHAEDAAQAALRMRDVVAGLKREREAAGEPYWNVRIGLHCGPLVAGVIGRRKFSYDVWGDTVNVASRMESAGEPGRINVSRAVRDRLDGRFVFTSRGRLPAKHKGELEMFFLDGPMPAPTEG